MQGRITSKWRPKLGLVLALTLVAVLGLAPAGVVASRWLGPKIGWIQAQSIMGVLIVIFAATLGWVLWRILYGPISALAERAEGVKRGDQGALEPLEHYGTREMQELGQAILDMGRVLKGREAVVRSYADHATHELRSPLTVMRGAAELLGEPDLTDANRARLIGRIEEAADRMEALLEAQRALARAQEPFGGGRSLVSEVLPVLAALHQDIDILQQDDVQLPISKESAALIFGHLISNASAHGAVNVTVTCAPGRVDVVDDGPGISEGNRARIFDPFFTTRRAGGGTGMGLAIVRRMLEAHGAEIALAEGPGAHFVITF